MLIIREWFITKCNVPFSRYLLILQTQFLKFLFQTNKHYSYNYIFNIFKDGLSCGAAPTAGAGKISNILPISNICPIGNIFPISNIFPIGNIWWAAPTVGVGEPATCAGRPNGPNTRARRIQRPGADMEG
jgi:hypothetical protein